MEALITLPLTLTLPVGASRLSIVWRESLEGVLLWRGVNKKLYFLDEWLFFLRERNVKGHFCDIYTWKKGKIILSTVFFV